MCFLSVFLPNKKAQQNIHFGRRASDLSCDCDADKNLYRISRWHLLCLLTNLQRTMVADSRFFPHLSARRSTLVLFWFAAHSIGIKWKCEKRGKCIGCSRVEILFIAPQTLTDVVDGHDLGPIQVAWEPVPHTVEVSLQQDLLVRCLVIHNRNGTVALSWLLDSVKAAHFLPLCAVCLSHYKSSRNFPRYDKRNARVRCAIVQTGL